MTMISVDLVGFDVVRFGSDFGQILVRFLGKIASRQLGTEILRLGWASFCCETVKLNPTPPNHHHKYLYQQSPN